MLVGLYQHNIPVDLILFADTGAEHPHTYQFIQYMNQWLSEHELPAGTMEPLTGDRLDGFLEATEQANAIPQPQAWNGIDGLLNGNQRRIIFSLSFMDNHPDLVYLLKL